MRRALVIFIGFILLLVVGVGLYFFFVRSNGGLVVTPTPDPTLPTAGQVGSGDPDTEPTASTTPDDVTQPTGAPTRLAQISKGPVVAGETIVPIPSPDNASSTDLAVRYIERRSGNVFHYNLRTGSITRTSNRTVPGIMSAKWLPDGSTAFVRYLSGVDFATVNTYALRADGSDGYFLPQNISDLDVSSSSVLTLASGVNGSAAALVKTVGGGSTNLFTSPLSALRVAFAGKGSYLAFTKPSATLAGAAFVVDASGRFSRVVGPYDGLVALASPSGTWLLVSYTQNDALQTHLVNVATREDIALPIDTLADKCVWAPDDSSVYCGVPISPSTAYAYPDDWYQGAVSFSDRVWKIDVAGRFAQLVLDFSKETGAPLDAHALAVDATNSVLTFVNKNDRSLWVYRF
jgi:hypothetical protein